MMKRLSFPAALLTLAMLFTDNSHAATILVYGDSLSAGFGLQAGEEWPALLQKKLEGGKKTYSVVNASISGETTQGGLARFANTFSTHQPAIVILELGANDGLRGQPLGLMRENLGAIISHSRKHKAKVLLVSMEIPANYGKRYTGEFRDSFASVARQHGIPRTDFLLGGLQGKPELLQNDGLHPTAAAQPLLLETVWAALQPLL